MKLKRLIKLSIIFFIAFCSQYTSAQNNNKINSNIYYSEEFIINTDRDLFAAGETIYFKVYCSSNTKNKILISKILYAELINLNDKLSVYKGKYKIENNSVKGIIQIPENTNSGLYAIRVYTQWNRNFNRTNNFDKYISIINPQTVSFSNFITHNNTVNIIPSNNRVTIFVPDYIRKNKSYQILKNDSIFSKIKFYKGFYVFKNNFSDSAKYSLLQISESEDSVYYPFPKIKNDKLKIEVRKDSDIIKYKVSNFIAFSDKNLKLKIYSDKNKLLYNNPLYIKDTVSEQFLQSNVLKSGLNYIVLTNKNDDILNISCLYKRIKSDKNFIINTEKNVFSKRESVNLEVKYNGDEYLNTDISVILKGTDQFEHGFNPNYLFQDRSLLSEFLTVEDSLTDKEIKQILTLYNGFLNEKKTDFFTEIDILKQDQLIIPDIRGVSLIGTVKNKKTQKALSKVKVILSSFKTDPQLHITYTNDNGRFIFSLNKFYGKNDLFICTEDPEKQKIFINNPYEEYFSDKENYTVFFNSNSKVLLKRLYENAQLHNTFSLSYETPKRKTLYNIQANFKEYHFNDYIQFKSIKEAVYEIIPEVQLKKNNDGTYSFVVFNISGNRLPGHPLVLFDNIPVYNIHKIINADYSAISHFDVLNEPYVLGKNIINGIISIHTNNNDLSSINLSEAGYFIKYDGMQMPYEDNFLYEYNKTTPDFRNTLFWKPGILINKKGINVSFKTSDNTGIYKIIVKGIDSDNNYVYSSKYIRVK